MSYKKRKILYFSVVALAMLLIVGNAFLVMYEVFPYWVGYFNYILAFSPLFMRNPRKIGVKK